MEDIPTWLSSCHWDVAMFQEVSSDWENMVMRGYHILVGDKLQGERRCAIVWRSDLFEVR